MSAFWCGVRLCGECVRFHELKAARFPPSLPCGSDATLTTAEQFNAVVQSHWGIDNRFHWRPDVVMNEDQDRNRMDNRPYKLAILRHMAMNIMQKEGSKGSLRGKFKRAGWDDTYLCRLLA